MGGDALYDQDRQQRGQLHGGNACDDELSELCGRDEIYDQDGQQRGQLHGGNACDDDENELCGHEELCPQDLEFYVTSDC